MKYINKLIIIILANLQVSLMYSQTNRFDDMRVHLESLANTVPALNDSLTVSVNGETVAEFLRAAALTSNINLSIDSQINSQIVNNYKNVRFLDLLIFLAEEHNLDIRTTGNIISVFRYRKPDVAPPPIIPYEIKIDYQDSLLTWELKNDTLISLAREITKLTGTNIVISKDIHHELVSGYVRRCSVQAAVDKLALANGLQFQKLADGSLILDKIDSYNGSGSNNLSSRSRNSRISQNNQQSDTASLRIVDKGGQNISIIAVKAPLDTIIRKVSDLMKVSYHIVSELKGDVDLVFSQVSYIQLLDFLFQGTDFTYRLENGIYIFGTKSLVALQETKIIQLQFRTIDDISKIVPKNIQTGLEIIEFAELNSILVTGTSSAIAEFDTFIRQLDRPVPVILIELMIVESKKSSGLSTGISSGFGKSPSTSTEFLSNSSTSPGGINFSFDGSDVNSLLNSFTGFTGYNIGRVGQSFYLNISALESEGMLKVRSTPKLSTLNGHEAFLTSGETTYYVDETISTTTSQSINERYSKQYKAVNADLNIKIRPIVSGDNQITLTIDVSQSDFTGVIEKNAPPGTINRSFKSIIRVRDQETILLGGLEKNYSNNVGTGIPFLSRIPVVKWLFASRKKEKQFNKLNIFIKPTVIN